MVATRVRCQEQEQLQPAAKSCFQLFEIDEIIIGKKLGSGGFSDVFEIQSFHLKKSRDRTMTDEQRASRNFMKDNARSGQFGRSRFAIKFLQEEWMEDQKKFAQALKDLKNEAKVISEIDHPNVLKLWGTGIEVDGYSGRHDAYFLILDRLHGTLDENIKTWQKQMKRFQHPILNRRTKKKQEFLAERLQVALDIAGVLEYVHSRGMIYRDLKPNNVGFDSHGKVKIFDFGLARSLPSGMSGDTFKMSGKAGTLRYMAPEVFLKQPYNAKADVYSFAHLLWEILTLQKPYDTYTRRIHREKVVKEGERLPIPGSLPKSIKELISSAWHQDIGKRPSMETIRKVLTKELAKMGRQQIREKQTIVLTEEAQSALDQLETYKQRKIQATRRRAITSRAA